VNWPPIDYGHTAYDTAVVAGDVYGIKPDPKRAGKRPLAIAVVGCGGVAQAKWLPAIRYLQTRSEPVTIAGLVDIDATTRDKVTALYAAPTYPALAALLAAQRPDLVLVLTSDGAHVPVARAAIAAGIPVLVEKPLARSLAEARDLCGFAESRGVLLASVANKRFSPPYAMAQALVGEGRLKSPPTLFAGKFTLGYPYVDILEAGTIHLLDLALWFMGPVAHVSALGRFGLDERLESAVATIAFTSGAIGSIVTSAVAMSFKPWERVEIVGRNAMLVVEDQLDLTLHDEEAGPSKTWRPAFPNTLLFDESFGGYSGLLENVLDAVRGLAPLSASGRDGAAAVALVEAIQRSIAIGGSVTLDETPAGARETA
jgi:predicted dehydrogenase